MATAPVPSLKTEGTLWFVDLTVEDPLYMLPILAASSLYILINVGGDGVRIESMPPLIRTLMKVIPIVSFPGMCMFPAALNVYWFTNNIVSVAQSRLLRDDGIFYTKKLRMYNGPGALGQSQGCVKSCHGISTGWWAVQQVLRCQATGKT